MRLKDKVAIVTGASRGIGLAVVERFLAEGATVVAGSSSLPSDRYPAGTEAVRLDVTREDHWSAVVDGTLDRHGRIDVLVNNAGIVTYQGLHELETADWRKVVAVNQDGVFFGMRAVLPRMLAQRSGSIINVSSIWGAAAVAGAHAYHATKGAVLMMTRNAAITYAKEGIRINSVLPGFIDTPLTQSQDSSINDFVVSSTPIGRPGTPQEIANGCLFLASDESSFMTGADLVLDGGYLAQ